MRCCCCNRALNDYESTLKSLSTGEFLDACIRCLKDLDIEAVGNGELSQDAYISDDTPEEEFFDDEEY